MATDTVTPAITGSSNSVQVTASVNLHGFHPTGDMGDAVRGKQPRCSQTGKYLSRVERIRWARSPLRNYLILPRERSRLLAGRSVPVAPTCPLSSLTGSSYERQSAAHRWE